jgi:hypothetical protein
VASGAASAQKRKRREERKVQKEGEKSKNQQTNERTNERGIQSETLLALLAAWLHEDPSCEASTPGGFQIVEGHPDL